MRISDWSSDVCSSDLCWCHWRTCPASSPAASRAASSRRPRTRPSSPSVRPPWCRRCCCWRGCGDGSATAHRETRAMSELDLLLAQRLERLAAKRGWTEEEAMAHALERGLMALEAETPNDPHHK